MDFVERAVLRLRTQPGFSRNRHFQAFSSPEGRRALRIHRHLRSLERALDAGDAAELTFDGERWRLRLSGRALRREAWLTPGELRLLCTNPRARAALGDPAGP